MWEDGRTRGPQRISTKNLTISEENVSTKNNDWKEGGKMKTLESISAAAIVIFELIMIPSAQIAKLARSKKHLKYSTSRSRGRGAMKNALLTAFLMLFLASFVWAQEKCEAPVWNVGDKWTYKDTLGDTWTNEVVDIKDGLFLVRERGSKDLSAYDTKTLNHNFIIEESGRKLKYTRTFRKLFDFPIFVGKKWTDTTYMRPTTGQTEVTYVSEFKVEGIEEVSTSAGVYKAYKIRYKQTNIASHRSGWVLYWYSPDVKNWVKREFEETSFWPSRVQEFRNAELISYELR
jgi:hypothetical protein